MVKQSIRVVVADDDAEQLDQLAQMVHRLRPEWEICALAPSIKDLQDAIDEFAPQILLLDIHLSQGSQPQNVVDFLRGSSLPKMGIVFVTGDPNFAVEAFELDIADYVIKPIKPTRLSLAMDRALWHSGLAAPPSSTGERRNLWEGKRPQWLTACRGADTMLLKTEDIVYFQAERKYTHALTANRQALLRLGIGQVETLLDPEIFCRIHRGTIVNLRHVDFARRDTVGRLRLHLLGRPETLLVSRPFEHLFRSL